jgi:hypothetical protein
MLARKAPACGDRGLTDRKRGVLGCLLTQSAGDSPILIKEMKNNVDDGNGANYLQQVPTEYYDRVP